MTQRQKEDQRNPPKSPIRLLTPFPDSVIGLQEILQHQTGKHPLEYQVVIIVEE